ncbi:MAG: DUF1934 domain-containing protein [Clostridiales bacterium]|nr:DUF1934 domain-containing protein [Candidatus Equinaster intestinalis]
MNDVIIDIKSRQLSADNDNSIELTTHGRLLEKDGKLMLSYDDSQTIKNSKIKTTIHADGEKLTLMRSGAIESRLVVEQGKRHRCFYNIPQGELMLGIYGEEVKNRLKADGGYLKMKYNIDINNDFLSENIVEIKVRKVEN